MLDAATAERAAVVRRSLARAQQQGLSVVLSTPDTQAPEGLEAAGYSLPPLDADAALTYLSGLGTPRTQALVDLLTPATAHVPREAFFLQILSELATVPDSVPTDPPDDPWLLRAELLGRFFEVLAQGRIRRHGTLESAGQREHILLRQPSLIC
jgi:hypothetical protein